MTFFRLPEAGLAPEDRFRALFARHYPKV